MTPLRVLAVLFPRFPPPLAGRLGRAPFTPPCRRLRPCAVILLCLAILPGGASAPARAAEAPGATPSGLWRTSGGDWLLLAHDPTGVWLFSAADRAHPQQLARRVPLVSASEAAPLLMAGPISAAACCLDGADRLHLAWMAGDTAYYARCPAGEAANKGAWQGPTGGPAPEVLAPGLNPRACTIAAGARPVVAGTREGGVALLRFDGRWQETFSSADGRWPTLLRDGRRELHLAFAAPDGIRYHRSTDGAQWLPREMPMRDSSGACPSLAVLGDRPVVAGVSGGKAVAAARSDQGWSPASLWDARATGSGAPCLGMDRHGAVWCVWAAGGWVRAARWLGDALGPALALGEGGAVLLVEQAPPDAAPDLGVLVESGGAFRVLKVPAPGLTAMDERPVRFLDLLEVSQMDGLARESAVPQSEGRIPAPADPPLLPGGAVAWGKGGKDLRAWFGVQYGAHWVGCTADWTGTRWSKTEPLRLASPRPWLRPPAGALAVIADDEEPDASRRYKMAAESAGPSASLLTSTNGLAWAYYGELPRMRPLSLVRDLLARAEERWKLFGLLGDSESLALFTSPDREHWYPGGTPVPEPAAGGAAFWNEEGMLLGVMNGGRTLVGGRSGGRLAPLAELPGVAGSGGGRAFAPPLLWNGRRRLFLAEADAWRWVDVPVGRWIGLRAAGEDRPGTCVTVPVALTRLPRRLRLDVKTAHSGYTRGGVRVEVLDGAGQPVPGYAARITRADGWRDASWGHGRALWKLQMESIRLRFTVEPDARLYGFRFEE